MIYLLLVIIALLFYIAFFTPEGMRNREIKRIQKVFNTRLKDPPLFVIGDPKNETNPDEAVIYISKNGEKSISNRKLAVMIYRMEEDLKD